MKQIYLTFVAVLFATKLIHAQQDSLTPITSPECGNQLQSFIVKTNQASNAFVIYLRYDANTNSDDIYYYAFFPTPTENNKELLRSLKATALTALTTKLPVHVYVDTNNFVTNLYLKVDVE